MEYFVYVQGSYDSVFVGPFQKTELASAYVDSAMEIVGTFDAFVMTTTEKETQEARYGTLPVYEPRQGPF